MREVLSVQMMPGTNNAVSPRYRIALYIKDLRAGGAQRVFLNLAKGFLARGFQVDLVLARREGALLTQVPAGVGIIDLGVARALAAVVPLRRYIKKRRPDVILSSLNYVNVTALLATRFFESGRIGSRQNTYKPRVVVREANILNRNTFRPGNLHDRVLLTLMRVLYRRADQIIVNAEDTRASLVCYGVVKQERITLIPNPVDIESIRRLASHNPSSELIFDGNTVLAVGSLSLQKNFALLIRAVARIPGINLVILGEGEERSALEVLINELGVANRVRLPGYVQNPFAFMARSDLFVLSSSWEGSANVLVEALASGVPVIATDCPGGAREILHPSNGSDRYGEIVPSNDVDALTAAIERLTTLPEDVLCQIRDFGRERAMSFDLDSITQQYCGVLGVSDPMYSNERNSASMDTPLL